ncbi:MAG: class GN sortase [Parvibaculaceae bacterium]
MTRELDAIPAFWMRRSRRAREGFREFRMLLPASPRVEERPEGSRLWIALAFLCAAAGFVLIGEGLWIKAKAALAQILLERAFAQSIATGAPVKPWSWADTWPVARISVPRLDASSIVLAGGSGQALAFGPGHLAWTPKPGERGTVVYAAHRDTHFRFLGDLRPGDEIKVTRDDGITFTYEMTGSETVRWDHSNIDAGAPGYNLALATCWPLDGTFHGPLRYVVHARLKPVTLPGGHSGAAARPGS